MTETIALHQIIKGSLQETEDWWRLIVADDGALHVEHEWSHTNPYKAGDTNAGTKSVSVEEFLADDNANGAAKARLKEVLAERGLG